MKIYTVYDSKAEAYMQPFYQKTAGLALRDFQAAANSEKSSISQHPADFTLFEIGSYDERTGKVQPLDAFANLGTALEHINQNKELSQ